MMNKDDLTKKLNLLGLDDKGARIYLLLLSMGVSTPLELARKSEINRTTIYRILESLNQKGLVSEIIDQNSTKTKAVSPEKLELLVDKEEVALKHKKKVLPELIKSLTTMSLHPSSLTQIRYYRGKKGLQQMMWNVMKAKVDFVGYGYADWNIGVGKEFAEKLRQKKVDNNIVSREIQNPDQIDPKKTYTQVKNYHLVHECKAIPKDIIEINHDTYIYNDVFAFSHFYEGELFGVEIHNKEIAKTQRQIFEVLWKIAKKV